MTKAEAKQIMTETVDALIQELKENADSYHDTKINSIRAMQLIENAFVYPREVIDIIQHEQSSSKAASRMFEEMLNNGMDL